MANYYERFQNSTLMLRDELAIDRTLLANERTFLAYQRSAVALVIAGVSMVHFASVGWFQALGYICAATAFFVSVIGLLRFRKMNKGITMVRSRLEKARDVNDHLSS